MNLSAPDIAIVGAGPAGLTLARLLHVSKVPAIITVFERDFSPTARNEQGGTLDLHTETGLGAIRECQLWAQFQQYARYDGEEKIICDKYAAEIVHLRGGGKDVRPEIDRHRLRQILLKSVPAECVHWDMQLIEVTADGALRFSRQGHENDEILGPFDLVVGCDGAWSKVRTKLTPVKPQYAGVSGYEFDISDPAQSCPHIDKWAGQGSAASLGDGRFLNCQRMGNRSLKVRCWASMPDEHEARLSLEKLGKAGILAEQKKLYHDIGWSPKFCELLDHVDVESLRLWTLYELPVGLHWDHKPGFTLIGDAASLATPFSGEGVNKAMKDAQELASAITMAINSNYDLNHAISQFESQMHPRSEKLQRLTLRNKQIAFSAKNAIDVIPLMLMSFASESSSLPLRLAGSYPVAYLIWCGFWVWQRIGWMMQSLRG